MNKVWRITMDTYGDDARLKDGGNRYSMKESGDLIAAEYLMQPVKPRVEVYSCGLGMAMADYLNSLGVEAVVVVASTFRRIGNCDLTETIDNNQVDYKMTDGERAIKILERYTCGCKTCETAYCANVARKSVTEALRESYFPQPKGEDELHPGVYVEPPEPLSRPPIYALTGEFEHPIVENAQPFCFGCKSRRDVDPQARGFLVFHSYCSLLDINIAGHPDPEECPYESDAPSIEPRVEKIEKWIEKHIEENRP